MSYPYPSAESQLHKRIRLWFDDMGDHLDSCRRTCHTPAGYGRVRRCLHGRVMYCKGAYGAGSWRYDKWTTLTPWRTPVRYRRALAALREVQS